MDIDRVDVHLIRIPLHHSFRTSMGTMAEKTAVIIRLEDSDGVVGYGEAPAMPNATYTEESAFSAFQCCTRDLAPLVVGRDFTSAEALLDAVQPIRGNRFAKTGFETALWDLLGRRCGEPLSTSLGGTRTRVPVGDSLEIADSLEALLDLVDLRLSEGYRRIKLKIEPGWDRRPVEAVRQRHPDLMLTVDANAAYTLADSALFEAMDELELTMIEQPLAFDDLLDHSILQSRIRTPICLDESIRSVADTRLALHLGSTRIVNIKTGRVGGVVESRRIHDLCAANGIPVWMGGVFETGIGRSFNLAVASLANFSLPADMSPPLMYFESDLVLVPFRIVDGYVDVPTGPGAGFDVDVDRLAFYTDEHSTFTVSDPA